MKLLIEESVLRQALEALEEADSMLEGRNVYIRLRKAIPALRSALDSAETVESLRVDAERYRYFVEQLAVTDPNSPLHKLSDSIGDRSPTKEELDAAIDAAMKEST